MLAIKFLNLLTFSYQSLLPDQLELVSCTELHVRTWFLWKSASAPMFPLRIQRTGLC